MEHENGTQEVYCPENSKRKTLAEEKRKTQEGGWKMKKIRREKRRIKVNLLVRGWRLKFNKNVSSIFTEGMRIRVAKKWKQ